MASDPKKRKYSERWCPHCATHLAKSTFYVHKDLYFVGGEWLKNPQEIVSEDNGARLTVPIDVEDHDSQSYVHFEEHTETLNDADSVIESESEDEIWDEIPKETANEDDDNDMFCDLVDNSEQPSLDTETFSEKLLREFFLKLAYIQVITSMSNKIFMTIVKLILALLLVVAQTFGIVELAETLNNCSYSLFKIKKLLGLSDEMFVEFIVCPSCCSLYNREQAVKRSATGKLKSRRCSVILYPRHSQRSKRSSCGTVLMKTVKTKDGKEFLTAKKVFAYASLIKSLSKILQRPGFRQKCNQWRNRNTAENVYTDVYDGKIWKDFQKLNGEPFLESENVFGFMLNVDWFQPYKYVAHSVGVIYLSIMNLPREERFKQENMLVVGLIPGPNEPNGNINSFLSPLVDELEKLKTGVKINGIRHKGALLCVAADMPAVRKTCGFVGFSSIKGCSKCYKEFKSNGFGEKMDYSGVSEERQRDGFVHKRRAEVTLRQHTATAVKQKEMQLSARYSVLNKLDYFDPVRMHVIDPMHNLLLGTAKHLIKVWKEIKLLNDSDFEDIQEVVNDLIVPRDIGRIPNKISSSFSSLTADQWRHWTCIYSLMALKTKLSKEHYNNWSAFVSACRIFCKRNISKHELEDAHRCIILFLKTFERLYDKVKFCTPNMHMHQHLKHCIEDYGCVYGFWCFSFERMNGILGDYNINNHQINVTLMRSFQQSVSLKNLLLSDGGIIPIDIAECLQNDARGTANICVEDSVILAQPYKFKYFEQSLKVFAENMIKKLCGSLFLRMKHHYYSSKSVKVENHYITTSKMSIRNSMVMANINDECRPGIIRELMKVFVLIKKDHVVEEKEFIIARVDWLKKHCSRYHFGQNSSVEVWSVNFEEDSEKSFLPVENIQSRCGWIQYPIEVSPHTQERVTVVISLP